MTNNPTCIIDAHTHIAPEKAEVAVQIMDAAGVQSAVVCEWFKGFGETVEEHIRLFGRFPGRFFVFGNIDFSQIDEPDFADRSVEDLRRGVDAGVRGLKVFKLLGLGHKDASGQLLRVDDERLDPVWAEAGRLGIPVLIHTADPKWFWEPIDEVNAWGNILGDNPDWSFYRTGGPNRDELLAERNAVVRRHPNTIFIAPHLASLEESFLLLAEALEAMPNLYVDISARLWHMGNTPRRSKVSRELCLEFADRILFGTDLILLEGTGNTAIQPQTFLTHGHLPERLAGAGQDMLAATSQWLYEYHWDFLNTDHTQQPIPFLTNDPQARVHGLNLPADVLEKIYHANIERLLAR